MFVEKYSAFKEIWLVLTACLWAPPPSSDGMRPSSSAGKGTCTTSFENRDYQLELLVQILTLLIKACHLGSSPDHVSVTCEMMMLTTTFQNMMDDGRKVHMQRAWYSKCSINLSPFFFHTPFPLPPCYSWSLIIMMLGTPQNMIYNFSQRC